LLSWPQIFLFSIHLMFNFAISITSKNYTKIWNFIAIIMQWAKKRNNIYDICIYLFKYSYKLHNRVGRKIQKCSDQIKVVRKSCGFLLQKSETWTWFVNIFCSAKRSKVLKNYRKLYYHAFFSKIIYPSKKMYIKKDATSQYL